MSMEIVLEKFDSISTDEVGMGIKLHPCVLMY